MAVAALVLSIVALFVSAWYTRRQGVQRTEAARRHDELQPVLVGAYVQASDTRDGQRLGSSSPTGDRSATMPMSVHSDDDQASHDAGYGLSRLRRR